MSKPRSSGAQSADSDTTRAIAALIAHLREETGASQADLATAVGKTQPYVSARVRLLLPWTTNDLDLLAAHFGLNPFDFFLRAQQFTSALR